MFSEISERTYMPIVRGPLEMHSSSDFVCDGCDTIRPAGSTMFMGRVNGHVVHACSKRCFHIATSRIDKQYPVREVKVSRG